MTETASTPLKDKAVAMRMPMGSVMLFIHPEAVGACPGLLEKGLIACLPSVGPTRWGCTGVVDTPDSLAALKTLGVELIADGQEQGFVAAEEELKKRGLTLPSLRR